MGKRRGDRKKDTLNRSVLSLLRIQNIVLIDELELDFGPGLNLLTGETGSGKSIIVDSVGALTGERVSADLIRHGKDAARIEGVFSVESDDDISAILNDGGIDISDGQIIVRREIALSGKNRIFINDQLVTLAFLKRLGPHLAVIHGQGEQAEIYNVESHVSMLDEYAGVEKELNAVASAFEAWSNASAALTALQKDESERLQLVDVLRFQINEITSAGLKIGEDTELEAEKRRLANAEKLASLSEETFELLYDADGSTLSTLDRAAKRVAELSDFEVSFKEFDEGLASARAVIEELAAAARNMRSSLDISPGRLDEIEDRLADISRLKRKYGETVDDILEHLSRSETRLAALQDSDLTRAELEKKVAELVSRYFEADAALAKKRRAAIKRFEPLVIAELRTVALDKALFEVRSDDINELRPTGSQNIEFYFSANPGEAVRPLAKVASGGEASRLMLVLKSAARTNEHGRTAVFDEVDIGIGGRVAEAVGRKLKALSATQQVFCVTHQPQIASLADRHFVVEKVSKDRMTEVTIRELASTDMIDEIARMLAGEFVTDAARENARAMLAAAK